MSKIKKVYVERTPTNDVTGIATDSRSSCGVTLLNYHHPTWGARLEAQDDARTDYHLYFTIEIEDTPKEGEWVYYPTYVSPVRRYKSGEISNTPFRIIGSTDESLELPVPSTVFKKHYCRNQDMEVVYMEFEQEYADGVTDGGRTRRFYGDWKPKLDENGELTFTSKKSNLKDVLDENPHLREEFDELIYSAMKHSAYTPTYKLQEWKSENGFVWS